MAIHHDKKAYGRLAKTSEELSEEKIAETLKKLNGLKDKEDSESKSPEKQGKINITQK